MLKLKYFLLVLTMDEMKMSVIGVDKLEARVQVKQFVFLLFLDFRPTIENESFVSIFSSYHT